jgi:hypothetical protein
MSESSTTPAPDTSVPAEKPSLLRIVLFAVLAVMVVALIYEYGFVRRSYKAAETAVDDFVEHRNRDLEDASAVTPEVVQEKLRKTPKGGLEDKGDYYLEHYQWVRWLPWKTYDIYVVYEKSDPPQLFNTTRPDPPGPGEVPYDGIAFDPASIPPGTPLGPPPGFPGARPTAEQEGGAAPGEGDASQDQPAEAAPPAGEEKSTEAEQPSDGGAAAEGDSDAKPSESGAAEPSADDSSENE